MDIKQLEYYVQLYEEKKFSSAAAKLYITQQALSKSVRKLEDEVGLLLFRDKNRFTPTPLGDVLYKEARSLLEAYAAMKARLQSVSRESNWQLHIVAPLCVREYLFDSLAEAFCSLYPKVEIVWTELPDIKAEEMAAQDEFDLGFSIGLPRHAELFHVTKIAERELCLMVNEQNPLSQLEKITLVRDVEPSFLCCADERFKINQMLRDLYEKAGKKADFQHVSDRFSAYSLALKDRCVSISFCDVIEATAYKSLIPVPIADPSMQWEIYVISRYNKMLTPLAASFITFIKEHSPQAKAR